MQEIADGLSNNPNGEKIEFKNLGITDEIMAEFIEVMKREARKNG